MLKIWLVLRRATVLSIISFDFSPFDFFFLIYCIVSFVLFINVKKIKYVCNVAKEHGS